MRALRVAIATYIVVVCHLQNCIIRWGKTVLSFFFLYCSNMSKSGNIVKHIQLCVMFINLIYFYALLAHPRGFARLNEYLLNIFRKLFSVSS